jgi:hypothetical protein
MRSRQEIHLVLILFRILCPIVSIMLAKSASSWFFLASVKKKNPCSAACLQFALLKVPTTKFGNPN